MELRIVLWNIMARKLSASWRISLMAEYFHQAWTNVTMIMLNFILNKNIFILNFQLLQDLNNSASDLSTAQLPN